MATLSVQIEEQVTLNGRDFGHTRTNTITCVTTIDTRVFIATSTEMDLIKFDSAAGNGQFIDGALKYLRISHLSGSDDLKVRVVGTDEEFAVKIPTGGSLVLFDQTIDATQTSTSPSVTADGTVTISYANINKISVDSSSADITAEYFIATS